MTDGMVKLELKTPGELLDEIVRLREALEFARKRIVFYGTISDRRHFDHDLGEVYPKIDAALSNGDR